MIADPSVTSLAQLMADAARLLGDAANDAQRERLVREAVLDLWESRRTVTLAAADAAVRRALHAAATGPDAGAHHLAAA